MAEWDAVGASAVPLAGGYGGETFAVAAAGEDAVLRLYLRAPERAAVDVALLRLARGLLPVPRVLDAKPDGSPGDPPYVLTERLPGVNLETFLTTAGGAQRRRVGEQLGDLLATLSGIPFLRAGTFRDGDLTVEPFGPDDLRGWFGRHPVALAPEQITSLYGVIDAADALAAETDRVCLCHSDFNPKNLLVDPGTATITGLVDWEFAHAGSPYTDLGNLLRFCDDPVLGTTVLDVVRRKVPGADGQVLERARAADLWALVELASRAGENPVADAALELLRATAETGDLAAGRLPFGAGADEAD
jgi:aminoglycoside phosphotransferase (APT) family kinase protein